MALTALETRAKLAELKITSRTLVYPHKLRDLINQSESIGGDQQVSFVKLTPSIAEVTVPTIIPTPESATSTLEIADPNQVSIKFVDTGIDGIFLPIRPTEDTIVGSWQSVEGLGFGNIGDYLKWKGYKALSGVASTVLPQEAVFAMKSGSFGGGLDNPHDKLAFAGHSRRTFQIAWEFMKPSNPEEEETLNKIISVLRMLSLGSYSQYVIAPPTNWAITFSSLPQYKGYLNYRRCGFSSVSVKFGGDGDFHAMESGMPFMSLTLDVSELDYPVKDDVWIKPSQAGLVDISGRELTDAEKNLIKKNSQEIEKQLSGA